MTTGLGVRRRLARLLRLPWLVRPLCCVLRHEAPLKERDPERAYTLFWRCPRCLKVLGETTIVPKAAGAGLRRIYLAKGRRTRDPRTGYG